MTGEFVPIYILFDENYEMDYKPIKIKGNTIKFEGVLERDKYVYGLKLLGKLNAAYIESNTFDSSEITMYKKPDCAICIGDSKIGVPHDAVVTFNENVFKNFEEEVSDVRLK